MPSIGKRTGYILESCCFACNHTTDAGIILYRNRNGCDHVGDDHVENTSDQAIALMSHTWPFSALDIALCLHAAPIRVFFDGCQE